MGRGRAVRRRGGVRDDRLRRATTEVDGLARELEIVALLRSAGPALGPAPAARGRAKQRLMAAFARGARRLGHAGRHRARIRRSSRRSPSRSAPHGSPRRADARCGAPRTAGAAPALRRGGRRRGTASRSVEPDLGPTSAACGRDPAASAAGTGRAALLGAAAAAALVALAGTGTFASQDALPGDPMYGVKRVAESTGYALTFGEQAKARRHLEQAQRRLDEVEGMVARRPDRAGERRPRRTRADQRAACARRCRSSTATRARARACCSPGTPPDTAQVDEVRTWATRAVGAAVGHAVDAACAGPGRRVARAARPGARRDGRAAGRGVRPGRRAVHRRCHDGGRRRGRLRSIRDDVGARRSRAPGRSRRRKAAPRARRRAVGRRPAPTTRRRRTTSSAGTDADGPTTTSDGRPAPRRRAAGVGLGAARTVAGATAAVAVSAGPGAPANSRAAPGCP